MSGHVPGYEHTDLRRLKFGLAGCSKQGCGCPFYLDVVCNDCSGRSAYVPVACAISRELGIAVTLETINTIDTCSRVEYM